MPCDEAFKAVYNPWTCFPDGPEVRLNYDSFHEFHVKVTFSSVNIQANVAAHRGIGEINGLLVPPGKASNILIDHFDNWLTVHV